MRSSPFTVGAIAPAVDECVRRNDVLASLGTRVPETPLRNHLVSQVQLEILALLVPFPKAC